MVTIIVCSLVFQADILELSWAMTVNQQKGIITF